MIKFQNWYQKTKAQAQHLRVGSPSHVSTPAGHLHSSAHCACSIIVSSHILTDAESKTLKRSHLAKDSQNVSSQAETYTQAKQLENLCSEPMYNFWKCSKLINSYFVIKKLKLTHPSHKFTQFKGLCLSPIGYSGQVLDITLAIFHLNKFDLMNKQNVNCFQFQGNKLFKAVQSSLNSVNVIQILQDLDHRSQAAV